MHSLLPAARVVNGKTNEKYCCLMRVKFPPGKTGSVSRLKDAHVINLEPLGKDRFVDSALATPGASNRQIQNQVECLIERPDTFFGAVLLRVGEIFLSSTKKSRWPECHSMA
jgi:hypothetical protein